MHFGVLAFSAALALMTAKSSLAATIGASNQKGCAVALSGSIEEGDSERLKEIFATPGVLVDTGEGINPETSALCLNSPGGNFIEGQIIARMVFETGIGTRLLPDTECYSACAFIFMAGRFKGDESDSPYRSMSRTARLGFHAPYLMMDDRSTMTGADTKDLLSGYNLLLGDFILFGSTRSIFDYRPNFSPALLGRLLQFGPDDALEVETIEDAERWGIKIADLEVPAFDVVAAYGQVCENFQAWSADRTAPEWKEVYPAPMEVSLNGEDGQKRYVRIDTGGMLDRYCLVRATEDKKGYEVCSFDDFNGVAYGDCPRWGMYVPGYYALPPWVRIRDLP
jgi:hypothetical protein